MRFTDIVHKGDRVELMSPDNLKASLGIAYRVLGEGLLFALAVYFSISMPILSIFFFYLCAIWHGFWGYAGIAHELFHARVFSSILINKLLFRLASYITWNNPGFFQRSHRHHHLHTFAPEDGEAHGLQNWSMFALICYVTIDIPVLFKRFFYVLINVFGFTVAKGKFTRLDKACQRETVFMLAFNLTIQVGLGWFFDSWFVNLTWFLLPFTGQLFNRLLAQSQHIGLRDLKDEGPLKNSRTVLLPKFFEFLYAGMNFHAEHHFAPGVPYYHLPKLHSLLANKGLVIAVNPLPFFFKEIWLEIRKSRDPSYLK